MLNLQKSNKLNHVHYDIRGAISDEANRMEQNGINIIKLNTGNPAVFGFEPPQYIPEIISKHLSLTAAYSESGGLNEAREAIVNYCKKKNISNVNMENVFTGNGVSELITFSLQALLNEGDEILIPAPDYPLWTAAAILSGGTPVHYICDEQSDWYPDILDIERKITIKTKAIVIINPNNPTGSVYPFEILNQIVDIARKHNLLIFSDEIYDRLVMDDISHTSIASLAPDHPVVTFNGLSKSHQLCGYRCGWMVVSGDKTGIKDYLDGLYLLASLRLCSNVTSQVLIKPALENLDFGAESLLPGGRLYEQREYSYNALTQIPGISAVKPKAGMYIFAKIDNKLLHIENDEKFVLDFLREKHVLLTHGGSFNWIMPDHFRLVYLPKLDDLKEVIVRLKDFLENYRQY